jgi:RNA polymerase sigma factor (sigma-70 family)
MANPSPQAPSPPEAEVELAERARAGDLAAFNDLVEPHQRLVFNLCLRMLGGPAAAEDATQEAFLAAWRNVSSFRGSNFRAWLMRIASNACTDELRRRGRRPAASLDAPPPGLDEPIDVPDTDAGPEDLALQQERRGVVQAALLTLPEDQRLAVVMCDIQGFSYEEIAEAMGTNVGTVKSRIARGREKLRRELVSRGEHPGGRERHTGNDPAQHTGPEG